MRPHPIFRVIWNAFNALLILSLILLIAGIGWEYSTREYLKGFADGVVPLGAAPEQKVEAMLTWMAHGPARRTTADIESLAAQDPLDTLNYQQLLRVCGSATNAFVNLAASAGLRARRLLLLGPDRRSMHVLAEVYLDGRWVVVDPAYYVLLRDAQGRLLTRQQLADTRVLREATANIAGYPPEYTFERTAHVRLSRIPYLGNPLRSILDAASPGWEEALNWTLVLERESLMMVVVAALLVCLSLAGRQFLSWYGERRLGVTHVRLREHLLRAGVALFSSHHQK